LEGSVYTVSARNEIHVAIDNHTFGFRGTNASNVVVEYVTKMPTIALRYALTGGEEAFAKSVADFDVAEIDLCALGWTSTGPQTLEIDESVAYAFKVPRIEDARVFSQRAQIESTHNQTALVESLVFRQRVRRDLQLDFLNTLENLRTAERADIPGICEKLERQLMAWAMVEGDRSLYAGMIRRDFNQGRDACDAIREVSKAESAETAYWALRKLGTVQFLRWRSDLERAYLERNHSEEYTPSTSSFDFCVNVARHYRSNGFLRDNDQDPTRFNLVGLGGIARLVETLDAHCGANRNAFENGVACIEEFYRLRTRQETKEIWHKAIPEFVDAVKTLNATELAMFDKQASSRLMAQCRS
jgi:hypothetical protein